MAADGLTPLVEALDLAEGFEFDLLVVDGVDDADAALGTVGRRLAERRPGFLISRIVPPPAGDDLAEHVLAHLPGPAGANAVVLDASSATNRDEPGWADLFQRMNSRRNGIARLLSRPLVLCVTRRMEQVLAREAPDLWSTRSARGESSRPAPRRRPTTRYEDVVDADLLAALERGFPDRGDAIRFLAEVGYPPGRLPLSDGNRFWDTVLRQADRGETPLDLEVMVRLLRKRLPGSEEVRRAFARLPERVLVASGWVIPRPEEVPWTTAPPTATVLAALEALPEGARAVLVGEVGSGRRTALRAFERGARVGGRPRVVLEDPWGVQHGWAHVTLTRVVASHLPDLAPILQASLHDRPLTREQQALLPATLAEAVPVAALSRWTREARHGLLYELARRLAEVAEPVWVWGGRFKQAVSPERLVFALAAHLAGLPGLAVAFVDPAHARAVPADWHRIHVPPWSPVDLLTLWEHRKVVAPPRARALADDDRCAPFVCALAESSRTPGAFLRWVHHVVSTASLPPTPAWGTAQPWLSLFPDPGAARLYPGEGPEFAAAFDAVALARRLDGVSLPSEEVAAEVGETGVTVAFDTGFLALDPVDPRCFQLAPLAWILRPSSLARIRAAMGWAEPAPPEHAPG